MTRVTEWPEARVAQLRALWVEGLSTAQIGRRMGLSKNSVVGKVGRLGLPGRASPIKPREAGSAPPLALRRVPTPGLESTWGGELLGNTLVALGLCPPVRVAQAGAAPAVLGFVGSGPCAWPMWGAERAGPAVLRGALRGGLRPQAAAAIGRHAAAGVALMVAGVLPAVRAMAVREVRAALDGLGHRDQVEVMLEVLAELGRRSGQPALFGALLAAALRERAGVVS